MGSTLTRMTAKRRLVALRPTMTPRRLVALRPTTASRRFVALRPTTVSRRLVVWAQERNSRPHDQSVRVLVLFHVLMGFPYVFELRSAFKRMSCKMCSHVRVGRFIFCDSDSDK